MMRPDYDNPDHLTASIAALTLKARPVGLLADWLDGAEVPITIAAARRKVGRGTDPWLNVDELEELPWAGSILEATLLSDHLQGSSGLHLLTQVESLTITILGDHYDDTDLDMFHNAVQNLGKLKELKLIVSEAALGQAKDRLFWPGHGLSCVIETEKRPRKDRLGEISL